MVKVLKKILIVEDEASIANALKMKLEKEKFQVLMAENGQEGLALALKEKPDLILLDIVMPVMDGITMMKKLREDKNGKKLNVLVLTNLTYLNNEQGVDKYTASDYLVKSEWKISDLVKKIKTIIK